MRLTTFTDYTLRVLMYLAWCSGRLATIPEIARAHAISENHLMKVVHQLVKNGVVESVRGKGGGIRLARPAAEIRLGQVIRQAEGDAPIVECLGEAPQCVLHSGCRLKKILVEGFGALYEVLDRYTLADATVRPEIMAACGGPTPAGPRGIKTVEN